jgi:hypothetical protein
MTSKAELIKEAIFELRKAQHEIWRPDDSEKSRTIRLPPTLWLGDGSSIRATERLLVVIAQYTEIFWDNHSEIKSRIKFDELIRIAEQSFAVVLAEIDLEVSTEKLLPVVCKGVAKDLMERIERHTRSVELTLGCHLFEGSEAYPIRIGPVLFETRESWRCRAVAEKTLSKTASRRLDGFWQGKSLKKRIPSNDSSGERAAQRAIGDCPIVCSVSTEGLSSKYVEGKGLLAARIAMTAISLMWHRPSEGLQWMNLLYDRRSPHRHIAFFSKGRHVGYKFEMSQLPAGYHIDPEILERLLDYRWLFETVGEAIDAYVKPSKSIARPAVMNALFLSLWWYHEACREPMDQIATTKFAASMDALANGKGAPGIKSLIQALIGRGSGEVLMSDGRTTTKVIDKIYGDGRSKLIHGSSINFMHDWSEDRESAEAVGRLLIIMSCRRFFDNQERDTLGVLLEKKSL